MTKDTVESIGNQLKELHRGIKDILSALDYDNAEKWVAARVEHNNGDYYIYGHKEVSLEGLNIRVRK